MTGKQRIVTLERVDVDIAGRRVLHGIDLSIAPGEHFGVVGPNGSGKTCLLSLLAGSRWPAPGTGRRSYDFGDGPESDAVRARRRVTLIGHELQDSYRRRRWNFRALDIVLSGFTRSDIPRRNPEPAMVAEAEALLEAMGSAALAERRFLSLSRGEQRRVLIARAMAFEPTLLLLDEPMSGLDSAARRDLEAALEKAAAAATIVVAAHTEDELPSMIGRIVRLDAGRLTRGGGRSIGAHNRQDRFAPARVADRPTARARTLIELTHVSVWLGGRQILRPFDWTLVSGDHWLITGRNGAGKSTFLRLLNAEIRPACGGAVRWPGLGNPADVWQLRRQVALVSAELQARFLFPSSVFETVASGFDASIGLTRTLSQAERKRVDELLETFDLAQHRDRRLSSLSYGQRRRALLARMLCPDPKVLLLDEPFEGLDGATRKTIAAELKILARTGTQLVCVSHTGAGGLPLNRRLAISGGQISDDSGGPAALPENSASARRPTAASRER